MIRSLRGRLFIGLTAIILLTGAIGGMFAYKWAFGEAIELQDSILIQLASLAQNASFSGGQPLHGVEEDTEVWLIELGKTPRGHGRRSSALHPCRMVCRWRHGRSQPSPGAATNATRRQPVRRGAADRCSRRNRARCGVSHAASDRRADSLPDGGHGACHRVLAAPDGPAGR